MIRLIAIIITVVLSFSLGGVHLMLSSGKYLAHKQAQKFQRIRGNSRLELETLKFSIQEFESLNTEDVGLGVVEFEHNGLKYDAFELKFADGQVHLLVKKDNLDTALNNIIKRTKRQLRAKSRLINPNIFNFYFFQQIIDSASIFELLMFYYPEQIENYSAPIIFLPSPPPR